MTASIEEDEREIGILKVLGIPLRRIKQLYVGKYALLACVGCIAGYGLTLIFGDIFTANIQRYMGIQPFFYYLVHSALCFYCHSNDHHFWRLYCPKKVWSSISRSSTSRQRYFNE
ncbi:FtsX-like permease family protein [Bacillus sp. SL00103]